MTILIKDLTLSDETAFHTDWLGTKVPLLSYFSDHEFSLSGMVCVKEGEPIND